MSSPPSLPASSPPDPPTSETFRRHAPGKPRRGPWPAGLGAAALLAAVLPGSLVAGSPAADAAASSPAAGAPSVRRFTAEELETTLPVLANPYLAWLPPQARPDWAWWRARLSLQARQRRAAQVGGTSAAQVAGTVVLEVVEEEPAGAAGVNDHPLLAQPLPGLGTAAGLAGMARISGQLLAPPVSAGEAAEPDGSIPEALAVAVADGAVVSLEGVLGDGPFGRAGSGSGDFDFYAVAAAAGQRLEVTVRTPEPLEDLDPVAALYSATGQLLIVNDDLPIPGLLSSLDSYFAFPVELDGLYYVAVAGHRGGGDPDQMLPADPFDAASGRGAGSEGVYRVTFGLDAPDPGDLDVFAVELRVGDVIGAALLGGARALALYDPLGRRRVATVGADLSGLYPQGSPLPGGGDAAVAYVAETAGTWAVGVERPAFFDQGAYTLELTTARPALDRTAEPAHQILFLDFDGATLDRSIFGVPPAEVHLSPLAAFLAGWGLSPADEDALVEAVVAAVEENLSEDLRARGGNGDFGVSGRPGDFDLEIRNSRDHADPFGLPHVSRVVIGGTIEELGLATIGLAESVDPGDFATAETAVVLLDLLSSPAPSPASLNSIPLAAGATRLDLVGAALGTIAAHEAGHLFADFHTRRDGGPANVMDRGGNLPLLLGVGADGVFGTGDDVDVDFGPDAYEPAEGLTGVEDTLEAVSFGLPAGGPRAEPVVSPARLGFGPVEPGASASRVFELSNEGSLPLSFAAPELVGPGGGDFSLGAGAGPGVLEPGEVREVEVRFHPAAVGPRTAAVRVSQLSPEPRVLEVPLAGQGGVPRLVAEPPTLDFGAVEYGLGPASTQRPLAVSNPGDGALEIAGLILVGPAAPSFGTSRAAPSSGGLKIGPGETAVLPLDFRPGGRVGEMEAVLRLAANAPDGGVLLTGRAFGPDIAVAPFPALGFGALRPGTTASRPVTVTNRGNRLLTVASPVLAGEGAGDFSIESGGSAFVLAPEEFRQIAVAFAPGGLGTSTARLILDSDDPDHGRLEVRLAGEGVEPVLTVEPMQHDFGDVALGSGGQRTFRLRNDGGARLRVSATALEGPGAEQFLILSGGGPVTLLPGGLRNLRLAFRPTAAGRHKALLVIDSDDPESPRTEIPLEGSGIGPGLVRPAVFP